MKKSILTLVVLLLTMSIPLCAQNDSSSNEVPRYEGLAIGVFGTNQYGIGEWSNWATATAGGGISLEYTLPVILPANLDLGVSIHAEYSHLFPKADSSLKSCNDIIAYGGAWLRIPFLLGNARFAFQPEIGYGMTIHNAEGQKGSKAKGLYSDQMFSVSPAIRWIPPKVDSLEVEVSPLYTFAPEKDHSLSQIGARIGLIFHFDRIIAANEKKKSEKLQKELAYIRENPEFMLGIKSEELKDFTPDGDGVHDTITFIPVSNYMSSPAESWSLRIIDPAGNVFRTWNGTGKLPKQIVWDGKSDEGEGVFSDNTYKAELEVIPCEKDRILLGMDSVTASVEGSVEIKTGVVLQSSGDNEWTIKMTSVPFDPNEATFNKLTKVQREELDKTIDEIVTKVNSIGKNATVIVRGYANNVSGTEKEDIEELIPLSQKRADTMLQMLTLRGISEDKITAEGRGGADPIASREDRENWWKNRRIEFIIKK